MNFTTLNLIKPLRRALNDVGYSSATEIQSKTIPLVLNGRDVIGCAQTGTGKTAAFALPVLQQWERGSKQKRIHTLILTPTRELAIQIEGNLKLYARYLNAKSSAVYGGVPQGRQVKALRRGVDILVATPGRLLDLIGQGYIDLSKLEVLVLDEADRMLDMGFIHDIRKVLKRIPENRQTLFFSATLPKSIRKFAYSISKKPVEVAVAPVSSAADTVEQSVYFVERNEKVKLLLGLLNNDLVDRSLVFTRTKYGADKLTKKLKKAGIYASAIHGNKSQNARQRALRDFKNSKTKVLVATDIASRGIDIEELPLVVNYELPDDPETYVHRIGRTGRAGNEGVAVSFCDKRQKKQLRNIQNLLGFKVPVKHDKYLAHQF